MLIRGDRIAEVGASVQIPREARVIDLSAATVLPGMIDTHVHVNTGGQTPAERALIALTNAQIDLEAGFTTVLDMDSRGGFNTVDLRDAINAGLVAGPRMQVVGQSLNQRAGTYYPDDQSLRFLEGFTENKNVNSPWLARAAVREAKLHGVDWIKIYTTQDFVGPMYMWKPDATLVASPSLTREEVDAIVDEAHRLGLKVACHTYGGEGMFSCLNAGVDAPNHLLELDEAGVKILLQKRLPFVVTLDDLIALEKGDLEATGGKNSRLRMAEQAFTRARAAGVPIVYGSGATSDAIPHGKQADQFEVLRAMGDDACPGVADGIFARGRNAELRMGESRREPRKREVRGCDRGIRQSSPGRLGSRTGEVCDEGRGGGPRRTVATPGFISHPVTWKAYSVYFSDPYGIDWKSPRTIMTSFARHSQNAASRPASQPACRDLEFSAVDCRQR